MIYGLDLIFIHFAVTYDTALRTETPSEFDKPVAITECAPVDCHVRILQLLSM